MDKTFTAKKICYVGLFTALNVVLSSFGMPVPGGRIYLNDVVICFAALIFDPFSAFVIGGVGSFLGDFFFYPTPMFVSLVTHGLQAVAISSISHRGNKPTKFLRINLGLIVGLIIMVLGYSLGRAFIYSTPQYALLKLPFQFAQALTGVVVSLILYYKTPIKDFIIGV